MSPNDTFIKALARCAKTPSQFKCVCCKVAMPVEEMSTDAKCHGWCIECDEYEKEACKRDAMNDRDGVGTGWHDSAQWDD